jgi:hypothetical protein
MGGPEVRAYVSGMVRAVIAAALLASAGCAPVAGFRPPAPLLPDRSVELGAGGVALSPRPYVQEPWRGAGQLWAAGPISKRFDLGAVAAFDLDGAAVGATLRLHVSTHDRFALAVDTELGWGWISLSVPLGVRLFDETWLYTAPRLFNWGQRPAVAVPVGLSVRIADGFFLRAEAQAVWPDLSPYQRRWIFGLGAAQQL